MRKLRGILGVLAAVLTIFLGLGLSAHAQSMIAEGTYSQSKIIEFVLSKPGVLYLEFSSEVGAKSDGNQGVRITLSGYPSIGEGTFDYLMPCFYESIETRIPTGEHSWTYMYWPEEKLPAGKYTLEIQSLQEAALGSYKMMYYDDFADSLSFPESISVRTDGMASFTLSDSLPEGSFHGMNLTVGDSNVAMAVYDNDGTVYIYGLNPGTCSLTATLANGKRYICIINVTDPSARLAYKSCTLSVGETFRNYMKFTEKTPKWSSSNKKIATVNSSGKVTGRSVGTCTITAKIGKKKYKCKITVTKQQPNFGAYLCEYNPVDNYFVVQIRNKSNKPLTICSNGSEVRHVEKKSYNRNVRLAKNKDIVIKPGKSARVKFYVRGNQVTTNFYEFTLYSKVRFKGQTYPWHVWNTESLYRLGTKWKKTYWNNSWYEGWLQ